MRAVLPDSMTNGLGSEEDPVAYVMRHTQLLPRHLILNMNAVLRSALKHTGDAPPKATPDDVLAGIREAEHRIVEGILRSYSYQCPHVAEALDALMNRSESTVMSTSSLHRAFNQAGVRAKAGIGWNSFLQEALAVGALGIAENPTGRYVHGTFAYTFEYDLRPVEDRDDLCVHPLFMYRFFDPRNIRRLAANGVRPVYPAGSTPEDAA
jgi:hypothetical protein